MSNRMNDVSDRLSKLEGASSFLATKEDIALVKGDIEKISTNSERIARIEGEHKHLATKNEVQVLRTELQEVRSELREEIAGVRTELQKVRSELREEIAEVRTEPREPKWLIVVKDVIILISLLDHLLGLL